MVFGRTYTQRAKRQTWFAWRPVLLDNGQWIWLEYVNRQLASYHSPHLWRYSRIEAERVGGLCYVRNSFRLDYIWRAWLSRWPFARKGQILRGDGTVGHVRRSRLIRAALRATNLGGSDNASSEHQPQPITRRGS